MTILDIGGAGLSGYSVGFFHALAVIFKLAAGSFMIFSVMIVTMVAVVAYSLYSGYQKRAPLEVARTFIHFTAYTIGAGVALLFILVAGIFFTLAATKLLFLAALIGFTVSFVLRETVLFLVLKRFGKYLMYFTALQYLKEMVYPDGEQQNHY